MLTLALQAAGAPAVWTEWNTEEPACPRDRLGYGSPTILVNGKDVAPGPHPWKPRVEGAPPRCRIYPTADGMSGVPPRAAIEQAIERVLGPEVG